MALRVHADSGGLRRPIPAGPEAPDAWFVTLLAARPAGTTAADRRSRFTDRLPADTELTLDAATRTHVAPGKVRGQRTVFGALRAERVLHRVIALVAFVGQEHAAVERRQRNRDRERLLVGDRIIHGQLILDDVVGDALQPFGQLHPVAVAQPVAIGADAGLI